MRNVPLAASVAAALFAAALLAAVLLAAVLAVAPSGAGGASGVVPPEVVVRQLTRQGFYGFRQIARRGDRYVIHAFGPRGRAVRIVADAHSGEILRTGMPALLGEMHARVPTHAH